MLHLHAFNVDDLDFRLQRNICPSWFLWALCWATPPRCTGSFISPSVLEHVSEPMPPWWWHHPIFKRIERLAAGSAGLVLCKHRAYSDLQHPEPITAAGMNWGRVLSKQLGRSQSFLHCRTTWIALKNWPWAKGKSRKSQEDKTSRARWKTSPTHWVLSWDQHLIFAAPKFDVHLHDARYSTRR